MYTGQRGSYYKGWFVYTTTARCHAVRYGVKMNNLTRDLVHQMIDLRETDEANRLRELDPLKP